ncbi:hypothetical protein [Microbulbifer variabilis]|uniref:hypothetical protein n=1 Tax=Microbulbifer variabilis TaxID=266805 RepID=UPI001CFE8DFE|nr:hypothetical protein [Microbulbifer variabilis]
MSSAKKSHTEKMKDLQDRLKKRSEEIFKNGPDFDEPQYTGDPSRVFEEDESDSDDADSKQSS